MNDVENILKYIKDCNSIINELLEDDDEYEELPYWENEVNISKEKINNIMRKEEIFNAAESFANVVSNGTQDSYFDIALKTYQAGAKWADEHPRKGLVDINEVCEYLMKADKGFILTEMSITELRKHFIK